MFLNASEINAACPTPGMKIRSGGRGRGLARGRGRGPIGVPAGMRGLGSSGAKLSAQAAALIQKIGREKTRADAASKFAASMMKKASDKASAAGLGIWPFTQISNAIADNVITPIAEMVGSETYAYVPTEKEIASAQQSVDQLKQNIEAREAAGDPVPPSTVTAAKVGEENVKSMVESREKILDPMGELGKLWRKVKWYAIGIGGLAVTVGMYGLYKRVSGK